LNAPISDGIFAAPDCIIGAGAIILKDKKQGGFCRSQNANMAHLILKVMILN
jgi:hypothetical protein